MRPPTPAHSTRSVLTPPPPARLVRPLASAERGFTLIELMAVVVIITLLMAIALPSIGNRLREYRSQQAANEIAALYRNARMRALARGAAVVVRWNGAARQFTALEAVELVPPGPGCEPLPTTRCPSTPADEAALVLVNQYTANGTAQVVTMAGPPPSGGGSGAAVPTFDLCFSPLGAASWRPAAGAPFTPLTGVPEVTVSRTDTIGLTRRVLVLPNGSSRVTI